MQYQESLKSRRANYPGIFPSNHSIFIDFENDNPPSSSQIQQDDLPLNTREATRKQLLGKILNQDVPGKDLLAIYIRHAFQKNYKLGSINHSYRNNIQFLSYLQDSGAELEDLQRRHIEDFVERQQDRGLNPSAIDTRLACIYAFIRFLVDRGLASAELLLRKLEN